MQTLTIDREALWREIGYAPHPKQRLVHDSPARFKVAVCGRRFGKSRLAVSEVLPYLFRPKTRGWIVAPQYDLGEREFRYLWDDITIKLGLGPRIKRKAYNVRTGEMYIEMPWGSRVDVKSADHPDGLVGEGLDWVIMAEAAKMHSAIWEKYIRPALADRRGTAIFSSTPEGHNHYFDLFKLGQDPKQTEWASWQFPSWENTHVFPGGFDDPEIQSQLRTPDDPFFWQEIGADFKTFVGKIYTEWNPEVHVIDGYTFNPSWDNYLFYDFGFCVDTETEILTKRGWLKHNEVAVGDECLGYDVDAGLAEWTLVEQVNTFDGTFDMRLLEHKAHSSLSTMNHRWPVISRYGVKKFAETTALKTGHMVPRGVPVTGLPQEPKYNDALVELVAWFWTEGYVHPNGAISIYQNGGWKADRIRKTLTDIFGPVLTQTRNGRERAPAGWVEREHGQRPDHFEFYVNVNGAAVLDGLYGKDKVIRPEFIAALTEAQLELFVDVSIMADGHTVNTGTRCLAQAVKERLDPFQMACQLLGYATNLYPLIPPGWTVPIQWQVSIRRGKTVNPALYPGKRVAYQGTVWCPTTSTGTWLARRKGTVYFTGNSNPFVALDVQRSPSDDLFVWREYYFKELSVPKHASAMRARQQPEGYEVVCGFGDAADPGAIELLNELVGPTVGLQEAKDVQRGIHEVKTLLAPMDSKPRLYVARECENLIFEFENYRTQPQTFSKTKAGANPNEQPRKQNDHALDALRYGVMHLFVLGAGAKLVDFYDPPQKGELSPGGSETIFQLGEPITLGAQF